MLSLIGYVIGDLLTSKLGRLFWRIVKRFPIVFVGISGVGQAFGFWLVARCGPLGDWAMTSLGIVCLLFYTGLLGVVTVKWWSGTWGRFCDTAASYLE